MRNRAKCKKCEEIIESFHQHDYVTCKCEEIAINGGNYELWTFAVDYENFLRIDDAGNEIPVQYHKEKPEKKKEEPVKPLRTREDLLKELEIMIAYDENLPDVATQKPVSQYDLLRYMIVVSEILKRNDA